MTQQTRLTNHVLRAFARTLFSVRAAGDWPGDTSVITRDDGESVRVEAHRRGSRVARAKFEPERRRPLAVGGSRPGKGSAAARAAAVAARELAALLRGAALPAAAEVSLAPHGGAVRVTVAVRSSAGAVQRQVDVDAA